MSPTRYQLRYPAMNIVLRTRRLGGDAQYTPDRPTVTGKTSEEAIASKTDRSKLINLITSSSYVVLRSGRGI